VENRAIRSVCSCPSDFIYCLVVIDYLAGLFHNFSYRA
jgi:hypothetical protein